MIRDNKRKACFLIDMSVPRDDKHQSKKISKYKELEIEDEKKWFLKTTTVPVGALVMIKKRPVNPFIKHRTVPADMKYEKSHFAEYLIT